ncbi:hypothetical protein B5X24_HaOG216540 [Helicoverpa armigera]|nr:hypothetical protein B5X24_HaOG216540 [Helicoverpa armigera]
MCRTLGALLQTCICGAQMIVRIFMILLMMIENILKLLLTTLYNFLSIILQIVSMLPVCLVFLLTSKLKCLFCGGCGCPGAGGGAIGNCIATAITLVAAYFILKNTGMLDLIFIYLGYTKKNATNYNSSKSSS